MWYCFICIYVFVDETSMYKSSQQLWSSSLERRRTSLRSGFVEKNQTSSPIWIGTFFIVHVSSFLLCYPLHSSPVDLISVTQRLKIIACIIDRKKNEGLSRSILRLKNTRKNFIETFYDSNSQFSSIEKSINSLRAMIWDSLLSLTNLSSVEFVKL